MDAREFFLENLPLIERVIEFKARRHGLNESDAEDFKSTVMIKLIDKDYAVIRKFKETSTFKTYITAVVVNAFQDYRIHERGKFRPSSQAKRLGPCAKELDRLLHRDQRTLEEAIPILLALFPEEGRESLSRLAKLLPPHSARPRLVPLDDTVDDVPASDDAEENLRARERREEAQRLSGVLSEAIGQLPKVDRQMLVLYFRLGMTIAEIARSLRIEQKLLYPRMKKLLKGLRETVENAGFSWDDVADLIGKEGFHLNFGLDGPSTSNEEKPPR